MSCFALLDESHQAGRPRFAGRPCIAMPPAPVQAASRARTASAPTLPSIASPSSRSFCSRHNTCMTLGQHRHRGSVCSCSRLCLTEERHAALASTQWHAPASGQARAHTHMHTGAHVHTHMHTGADERRAHARAAPTTSAPVLPTPSARTRLSPNCHTCAASSMSAPSAVNARSRNPCCPGSKEGCRMSHSLRHAHATQLSTQPHTTRRTACAPGSACGGVAHRHTEPAPFSVHHNRACPCLLLALLSVQHNRACPSSLPSSLWPFEPPDLLHPAKSSTKWGDLPHLAKSSTPGGPSTPCKFLHPGALSTPCTCSTLQGLCSQ